MISEMILINSSDYLIVSGCPCIISVDIFTRHKYETYHNTCEKHMDAFENNDRVKIIIMKACGIEYIIRLKTIYIYSFF